MELQNGQYRAKTIAAQVMDKHTRALMCTRVCRTCGETKQLEEFPVQRKTGYRGKEGTHTYRLDCKVCVAAAAREYRRTYVPQKQLRKDVDKYLYSACSCKVGDACQRAKLRELPFDLTTDYMYDLYHAQRGRCAVSGLELTVQKGTPHVLSIDQIDPGKGYMRDNVQWVSWAVNRAKGDLTDDEFLAMCRAVVRCNDYPEREYSQVAGSAPQSNTIEDIVCSA